MLIARVMIVPVVEAHAVHRTSFECMPVVLVKQGLIVEPLAAKATLSADILELYIASRSTVNKERPGATVVGRNGDGAFCSQKRSIGSLRDQALKGSWIVSRKLTDAFLENSSRSSHVRVGTDKVSEESWEISLVGGG